MTHTNVNASVVCRNTDAYISPRRLGYIWLFRDFFELGFSRVMPTVVVIN